VNGVVLELRGKNVWRWGRGVIGMYDGGEDVCMLKKSRFRILVYYIKTM
jgi:hypothetical protein